MKNTQITFICLYLFLIFGCSEKLDKRDINALIVNINPDQAAPLKLNSWVKRIDVIPLETTKESVLTGCYKIIDFNSRFYIQDQRQHTIFVFSNAGKFVFSTKHLKGKGPNEYSSIVDFDINRFTNNLEFLDAFERKIKIYDTNGTYIRAISLAPELLPLQSFIALTNDIYLFYSKSGSKKAESLLFYSISKKKILNRTGDLQSKTNDLVSTSFKPFYLLNDRVYFSQVYPSNSLYLVNPQSLEIEKILELDFGKYNFSLDALPENKNKEFYRSFTRNNGNRYAFVIEKIESEKCIFTYFFFKQKMYIAKYEKATKKLLVCYNEPKSMGQLLLPDITNGDTLYHVIEPGYVNYVIDNSLLDVYSKNILTKIKDDDNPVIVKYTLN